MRTKVDYLMRQAILCSALYIALLCCKLTLSLKHHLVLTNDHRMGFSVSSFGYLLGGRLDVIVQNLSLIPDPSEDNNDQQTFGFVLIKSDQVKNPFLIDPGEEKPMFCMRKTPINYFSHNLIKLTLDTQRKKVAVRCTGDNKMAAINPLPHNSTHLNDTSHSSYIHRINERSVYSLNESNFDPILKERPNLDESNAIYRECSNSPDLPLTINSITTDDGRSYSFNFTMLIRQESEEGFYYLTFYNCGGRRRSHYDNRGSYTPVRFNLSMLIYETNFENNYLSAGVMPLPQMYFVLSVMFFLIGCIWVNFIARQKDNSLKIHYLMTVLVFAKSCSLLFHSINYHYIARDGQPVVTWAYLYYATRSVKGALFFITLALIGSGWSFIKHILSVKDKKIILVIVALQVIAHIAEIILDESTEGEASKEFWAELCGMVDLFSCVAMLYPITWSVRHLEEASRTDGKAAINLKKLELFKRFYIISTIYIYITRIVTFIFLSMLTYRYLWLAELVNEFATIIYFIITGYYFQPMPTNPYLLLSGDPDLDEEILFSVDTDGMRLEDISNSETDSSNKQQDSALLASEGGGGAKRINRRPVEDLV